MNVLLTASGEGLGHASRMLALYRELERRGIDSAVASYGRALDYLKSFGVRAFSTRPEILMTGRDGRFDLAGSIIRSRGTPLDVAKAFVLERRLIQKLRADVVVSDTRFSAVLAAQSLGVPAFYVANQTRFILPGEGDKERHRSLLGRMFRASGIEKKVLEDIIDVPLSLPYPFAKEVLVPDFLPPNSLCLPLLSQEQSVRGKTRFVGPLSVLSSENVKPARWASKKTRVLVTFGGQQFREGEFRQVLESLSGLEEFDFLLASIFVKKPFRKKNVRATPFLKSVFPSAASADFLVRPAGHSGLMESILLQKPCLVIPDANWPEQESNASQFEKLGLGLALPLGEISLLPSRLRELRERRQEFLPIHRKLSLQAREEQNGARNVAELCEFI